MIKNIVEKHSLKNPIYIGDTAGDQNATKSAGIDFIYVAWGYGKAEKECLSFDSFTELAEFFRFSK